MHIRWAICFPNILWRMFGFLCMHKLWSLVWITSSFSVWIAMEKCREMNKSITIKKPQHLQAHSSFFSSSTFSLESNAKSMTGIWGERTDRSTPLDLSSSLLLNLSGMHERLHLTISWTFTIDGDDIPPFSTSSLSLIVLPHTHTHPHSLCLIVLPLTHTHTRAYIYSLW